MLVDVFRYRAFSGDSQGGLYAGGHRGVTHIRSVGTSQESKAYSNPVITDVKVGDKSIFFPYTSEENTVENISLDPNDRNIEIFFLLFNIHSMPGAGLLINWKGLTKTGLF